MKTSRPPSPISWRVATVIVLVGFITTSTTIAEPRFAAPTFFLSEDTLKVDLQVDSLFSTRTSDAIASGMTTSIGYEFLLKPVGPDRPIRHLHTLRLDHDIWEGRYLITSPTDSLATTSLDEATSRCSSLSGHPIAVLPHSSAPYVLRVRTIVNPISPEQEVKTRRWLNLLERGSVLELFFSFAPRENFQDWVEIARFRKADLPVEVPGSEADVEEEPEAP